jgi:hypothetical protein
VVKDATKAPIIGGFFTWDWYALEAGVRPALGDLQQALNAHERALERAVNAAELHGNNLRSNVALLRTSMCDPTGTYGRVTTYFREEIQLYRLPNGRLWGVQTRRSTGRPDRMPFERFSFDGRTITYTIGHSHNTGEIAPDYRSITIRHSGGGTSTYTR